MLHLGLSFHGFLKCQPAGSCTSERVPSLSLGTGPVKPESTVLVGGPRAAVPNCKERNGARLGNPPETCCLRTQGPLHPEKLLGGGGCSIQGQTEGRIRRDGRGKERGVSGIADLFGVFDSRHSFPNGR